MFNRSFLYTENASGVINFATTYSDSDGGCFSSFLLKVNLK